MEVHTLPTDFHAYEHRFTMVNLFRLNSDRQLKLSGAINLRRPRSNASTEGSTASSRQKSENKSIDSGSVQDSAEIDQIREIIKEGRSAKPRAATPLGFRLDPNTKQGAASIDSISKASTIQSKRSQPSKPVRTTVTMPHHQGRAARRISYSGTETSVIESAPQAAPSRRRKNASSSSHDDSNDEYWNRDDAVKALGFAAVKLKKRMQQKIDENAELRTKVAHLEAVLEELESARQAAPMNVREMKKMVIDKNESSVLRQQLVEAQSRLEWLEHEATSKFQQLETFEFELLSKTKTIEELQEKLAEKTRHIVELEVDLKFHDNTLASCAVARKKLEESLLSWQGSANENGDNNSRTARRFSLNKNQHTHAPHVEIEERQQKHIDQLKLLVKNLKYELTEVKNKFKSEKAEQEFRIDELEDECNQSKRKVLSLTRRLQELEREYRGGLFGSIDDLGRAASDKDNDGKSRLGFLEDRVKELEKQRARDKATIAALRRELLSTKEKSEEKVQKCISSIERLGLDNEAKSIRIAQLEMETVYRGDGQSNSLSSEFENIEKMIHDRFEQTDRLRSENETKEKKIAALRSELIHCMALLKPAQVNQKRGSLTTDATMSVTTHSTDRSSCASSAFQDIVREAERRQSLRDEQQAAIASRDPDDDGLLDSLEQNDMIRIHL